MSPTQWNTNSHQERNKSTPAVHSDYWVAVNLAYWVTVDFDWWLAVHSDCWVAVDSDYCEAWYAISKRNGSRRRKLKSQLRKIRALPTEKLAKGRSF